MSTAAVTLAPPTNPDGLKGDPKNDRPAWLPEKFKNAEDMAKSYTELEKMIGTQPTPVAPQPQTPPVPQSTPQAPPATPPSLQVPPPPPPGIDLAKYSQEYDSTGKLSEETYTTLQKNHNLTKEAVDQYIAGAVAQRQLVQQEVFRDVGGQEEYTKLTQWASKALTPQEIAAYNTATNSGDLNMIKLAVAGLKGKYVSTNGSDPKLLGGSQGTVGPAPFRSTDEMMRAMNDPKYKTDPAYQAEVHARLKVS